VTVKARVVVSPGGEHPYKVVIDRGEIGKSEHPVPTIKEGEALIRLILAREPASSEARPWNAPDRWTTNILKAAYAPPVDMEPDLMRLLAEAEAALAGDRTKMQGTG
jgi:hypothetical protein